MQRLMILIFALAFIASGTILADHHSSSKKNRYLLEMSHTKEQCLASLDAINKAKEEDLLNKIDWGCMSGHHTGYMTVEAESEEAATAALPDIIKKGTKVYQVGKFTRKQIADFHSK